MYYELCDFQVEFFPSKDDRGCVHLGDTLEDACFEIVEGGDSDVTQKGAGHF